MKTKIQLEMDNFTEDSELNENWNSTRERHFYGILRIKWKLKFNLTKTIFLKPQNLMKTKIQPHKDNISEDSELNEKLDSTWQRQFFGRQRIKWKLKFNPTKTILRKTQN